MRKRMTSGMLEKATLLANLKKIVGTCQGIYIKIVWESAEKFSGLFKFIAVYDNGERKELPSLMLAHLMNRIYDDEHDAIYHRIPGESYYEDACQGLHIHVQEVLRFLAPTHQIEVRGNGYRNWNGYFRIEIETIETYEAYQKEEHIKKIREKNRQYLSSFPCQFQGTYMKFASA